MIVLLGTYLGDMLNDIVDGRMPAGFMSMQLLLHMPETLGNILPLTGFVAVMWGLGRVYRDQEMAVMRSSGCGWRPLLKPWFRLVLPLAGDGGRDWKAVLGVCNSRFEQLRKR